MDFAEEVDERRLVVAAQRVVGRAAGRESVVACAVRGEAEKSHVEDDGARESAGTPWYFARDAEQLAQNRGPRDAAEGEGQVDFVALGKPFAQPTPRAVLGEERVVERAQELRHERVEKVERDFRELVALLHVARRRPGVGEKRPCERVWRQSPAQRRNGLPRSEWTSSGKL